jgi:hypothetical protein
MGVTKTFWAYRLVQGRELEIEVRFVNDCPIEAALSVVPTSAQVLPLPPMELLTVLADHPFHPRIVLGVDGECIPHPRFTNPELNDALREFRRPLHLTVPIACWTLPRRDIHNQLGLYVPDNGQL